MYVFNAFDFTTHTLGSSVVELITFAAISSSIIVLSMITAALLMCLGDIGKDP